MQKLFISILVISSFILTNIKGRSQTVRITNLSVINDLGHVRISWKYDGLEDLAIYRDNLEKHDLSILRTITDTAINSFIDSTAQAHLKPRLYKIQSPSNSNNRSDIVSSYYLTYNYDSCLQQFNLKWKDLVVIYSTEISIISDWTPTQFIININEDEYLRKENIDASNLEYSVSGILENTDYTIRIETQWQGQDSTSYSNPIHKFTKMPLSPEYIHAISALVEGNNTTLKFESDPDSELNSYKLLKSDPQTGSFVTLQTLTTTDTEITIDDYNSEPNTKVSYYKLVSVNECGNETTNSNIINNIVLKVEDKEFNNILSWNSFNEGSLISVNYEIYRIISNMQPELIRSFSNFNTCQNNIEELQNYSQFCYFVRATEEGAYESDYSQSNTACVYLKPKVYIPEAFTPNDDGTNDLFQIKYTFIPKTFELRVYNRWGNIIFETNNYTKDWNGKDPNGNSTPAGSYIYFLKIQSPDNQIIEKKGSITVIYP